MREVAARRGEIDRLELPPGARTTGVPHVLGTREYLACEQGTTELVASGERYRLEAGELVAFRGDQRHSYQNPGDRRAIGDSVVLLRLAARRPLRWSSAPSASRSKTTPATASRSAIRWCCSSPRSTAGEVVFSALGLEVEDHPVVGL